MALTGRAAAAALLGALVVLGLRTWRALVAVNAVLLAAIVADLVLAASVRRLRITRSGDTRVRLGETASVAVTVHNPGRRPLRARRPRRLAAERARGAGPGGADRRRRAARPTVASTLTPDRRGDSGPPAVIVRSFGPLGLAARQGRHGGPVDACGCCRRSRSRRHLPREAVPAARSSTASTARCCAGQGTEFDSLREYVLGDDVRSIDWRATARRADVVVRTWRPERDRRILLVLDTGRTSAGRVGDDPAAGRVDGRHPAADRARGPGRRPGRPDRVRPPACGPGPGRAAVVRAGLVRHGHGAAGRRADRDRHGGDGQRGAAPWPGTAAWWCCSPTSTRR